MSRDRLKRRAGLAGCYLVALGVIALLLIPIHHIFSMGFKTHLDAFAVPPKLFFTPTPDNYRKLFFQENFSFYLYNSFVISLCCVVFGLAVSSMAAYTLSRLRKERWANVVLFIILAIRMLPPMSLLLPTFNLYVKLHLDDTYLGVILLYLTFVIPLDVWMLKTFFDEVPDGIEEAATIDGCTTFQVFWRVAMPLIAEALAATAIFSWIFSWNEFLYAMIITRGSTRTAPVAVNNFLRFEDAEWGLIAAAALIISRR